MEIKKLWDVPLDTQVIIPIGTRLQKCKVIQKVEKMYHRYRRVEGKYTLVDTQAKRVTVRYESKHSGGYGNCISFRGDRQVLTGVDNV